MLNVLLTNDDGIEAEGLQAMRRALVELDGVRLAVIAPDGNRSAMARSITTRRPLWVEEVPFADGTVGYATDGTPVDCVRLASLGLVEDFAADLVVAGINHGANLGDDITYSGTVAAALEGVVLGLPAIAVSQQSRGGRARLPLRRRLRLRVAAAFVARLVERIEDVPLPARTLLNVNVPAGEPSGVEVTSLGKRIYRDELKLEREEEHRRRYWIYGSDPGFHDEPGTDLAAVAAGRIAVTPIHFDLTDRPSLEALRRFDLEALLAPPVADRPALDAIAVSGPDAADARRESCARSSNTTPTATTSSTTPRSATTRTTALLDELRGDRGASIRSWRAPTRRRQRVGGEPVGRLEKVAPPRADALARQRALGGGAARVGRADAQPPRARGHRAAELHVRRRAEDRRPGDQPHLPRRRARARRDARQRRDRRGRDAQPAHDRRDPAAPVRGCAAAAWRCAARSTCRCADFTALNERRAEAGESTFMNPRNSAAGTIRQLDPADAAKRPLSIWCYQVGVTEGLSFETHSQALEWLREHGFRVNRDIRLLGGEEEVIAQCLDWEQRRGELDFEIDGVVVKVDDLELQRRLGRRRARPALGGRVEVPADDRA